MPLYEFNLSTGRRGFYDITAEIAQAVAGSGINEGIAVVHSPHTTAGITINENADPDVLHDLGLGLDRAFPDRPEFRHGEGNSAAHLKTSCVGCGQTLIVKDGRLLLGRWQGIYFCEFDGPRQRRYQVLVR